MTRKYQGIKQIDSKRLNEVKGILEMGIGECEAIMMIWHSDYVSGIFVSWYTCPSCGYDTRNQKITWSDRTDKESEDKG